MFDLEDFVRYLTYLTYFGFIISSIAGLSQLNNGYDGKLFIISMCALMNTLFYGFVDIFRVKKFENITNYYVKSYFIMNISALLLSISPLGIGFGIWGIIVSVTNFFIGIFKIDLDTKIQPAEEEEA